MSGRAEATPKHTTRTSGTTQDDQNSCRQSGVCHRKGTEKRWCIKSKVARITDLYITHKSTVQAATSSSDDSRPPNRRRHNVSRRPSRVPDFPGPPSPARTPSHTARPHRTSDSANQERASRRRLASPERHHQSRGSASSGIRLVENTEWEHADDEPQPATEKPPALLNMRHQSMSRHDHFYFDRKGEGHKRSASESTLRDDEQAPQQDEHAPAAIEHGQTEMSATAAWIRRQAPTDPLSPEGPTPSDGIPETQQPVAELQEPVDIQNSAEARDEVPPDNTRDLTSDVLGSFRERGGGNLFRKTKEQRAAQWNRTLRRQCVETIVQ